MGTALEHPIRKVSSHVLSEWALMLVEEAPFDADKVFDRNQTIFKVSCHYRGVFTGHLAIMCQEGFLKALARNLLGADDDDEVTREQEIDALRELANVISGNFLPEAYGPETVFDLPSFKVEELAFAEIEIYLKARISSYLLEAVASYTADGHSVYICFDIDATEY